MENRTGYGNGVDDTSLNNADGWQEEREEETESKNGIGRETSASSPWQAHL